MKLLTRPFKKLRSRSPSNQPAPVVTLADRLPDSTKTQRAIIAAVSDSTMTSPERILALCDATEYVSKHNIPGDIVECGVWRGGSTAAAAAGACVIAVPTEHSKGSDFSHVYAVADGLQDKIVRETIEHGYVDNG